MLDELKIHPEGAVMNTLAYVSARGEVNSITDEAGREKSYQYDAMHRLDLVKDQDKNILNQYSYNFSPTTTSAQVFYFNTLKTGTYQKNDCTGGKIGTYVTYSVSAGSYTSSISQADADALAQAEITANGQSNANLVGKCYFYNVAKTGTFNRSNCGTGNLPVPMVVNVPAGTYTSEISQADADALAQSKVDLEGSLVNLTGTCYVPVVTISAINGQNTTSTLKVTFVNTSTNATYVSAIANKNETKNFSVPMGTYSITVTTTGVIGSISLTRNGSFQACNPSSWGTITVGTTGNEQLSFNLSSGSCAPPL